MKRLFFFLSTILVMYVIYYDLSIGTVPVSTTSTSAVKIENNQSEHVTVDLPYFEKKVSNGETVLSIVESSIDGEIPVSIEQVVDDFVLLNNGVQPEEIQFGEIYRFPIYDE